MLVLSTRTWLVRTGLFLLSGCFLVWIIPMSSLSCTLHVTSSSRVAVRMDGDIWSFLFHFLNRGLVMWHCSRVRGHEVKECNVAVGFVVSVQDVHLLLRLWLWQLAEELWFIVIYCFTSTTNHWTNGPLFSCRDWFYYHNNVVLRIGFTEVNADLIEVWVKFMIKL